jgi:hypothetical protein
MMAMRDSDFDAIGSELRRGGSVPALDTLVDILRREGRYHDFFEARLMQCRDRAGLPISRDLDPDGLEDSQQMALEASYLEACRETGVLLIAAGQIREAWMYWKTSGDGEKMREAFGQLDVDEENIDAVIETAIYEGVDTEFGFRQLLLHYGTCNAITTFESVMRSRNLSEQRRVAEILVRHLHAELLKNLLASLDEEISTTDDPSTALSRLVENRGEMFGQYTVHVDASHLSSVVRFARVVNEREVVALALDLTQYGCQLHENFQFPEEPPFEETYRSHRLLFAAQMGQNVDEAIRFFKEQAEKTEVATEGTLPAEVYVMLLARLGRHREAIDCHVALLPGDVQTTGIAPSLLDLARDSGDYSQLLKVARKRDDLLGFTVGEIEKQKQ